MVRYTQCHVVTDMVHKEMHIILYGRLILTYIIIHRLPCFCMYICLLLVEREMELFIKDCIYSYFYRSEA